MPASFRRCARNHSGNWKPWPAVLVLRNGTGGRLRKFKRQKPSPISGIALVIILWEDLDVVILREMSGSLLSLHFYLQAWNSGWLCAIEGKGLIVDAGLEKGLTEASIFPVE